MSQAGSPTQPLQKKAAIEGRQRGMLPNAGGIPSYAQLDAFSVNLDGWEALRYALYDTAAYAAAGANTISFFQTPQGQGTSATAGAGPKNASDTNMVSAGSMPQNQQFLIQSVELLFLPTTPTVAAGMPSFFGAQATQVIVNDEYIWRRSGNLNLLIGSKNYVQDAPMWRFPSRGNFEISAALTDVTTAAAASQTRTGHGFVKGPPFILSPGDLLLESNQNFSLTLTWPEGLQAITNPARIYAYLNGVLYRRSQ